MDNQRKLKTLDKSAKVDTQLAAGLVTAGLLSDDGLKSMQQVLQGANDPAQAIAHVIFMALGKVREKLQQKGMKIDDRVWIAGGGVLDRVIFEVMTALYAIAGFKQASDSQFVHSVKSAVLDLMHDEESGGEANEPAPDQDDPQQQAPQGAPTAQAPPGGPSPGMMAPMGAPQ